MASACAGSTSPSDDTFEASGDNVIFQGKGSIGALTAEEAVIYKADMAYIQSLISAGVSATPNHADERQHRFVLARLKMAGKTPENSPELFKSIAALRVEHISKGFKTKQTITYSATATQGIQDQHLLNSLNIINQGTQLHVSSVASINKTLTHGYVDVGPWDANGNQIGDLKYIEVYSNMPYASPVTDGNLSQTPLSTLVGDSLLVEDSTAYGHQELYTYSIQVRGPIVGTPTITGPTDINQDACVNVCISRSSTDCDYNLTNPYHTLWLPIAGSVSVNAGQPYTFDTTKIGQFQAGTATDQNGQPDPGGAVTAILTNTGGGCSTQNANNTFTLPETSFWATVSVSADKKTLSWNMTGANLANFGPACAVIQDHVELDVSVELPLVDGNGNHNMQSIYLSNGANAQQASAKFNQCFHVINSCLAAGTLIEMADGRTVPIEGIHAGEQVFSPYDRADNALAITDTTKGVELVPMIHIEEEHGRNLLLTEAHPVHVEGRGMVMARYLRVGDTVTTKDGPSHLVRVSRERYDGTVHNLKVGDSAELARLAKDQTAVYANGFLVGDSQIQNTNELAEVANSRRPTEKVRVPDRWRRDYDHMRSSHR